MLSLKIKRFCSRVIVSLSALGVFSIGKANASTVSDFGGSKPDFYAKGEVRLYRSSSSRKFVSNYPSKCATGFNVASATYSSSTTGLCTFTCASGTYYDRSGSYVSSFSVSGNTSTVLSPGDGCNVFDVVYDCTISGTVSGTSSQKLTVKAKKGSVFNVDRKCVPKSSAWEFVGWLAS